MKSTFLAILFIVLVGIGLYVVVNPSKTMRVTDDVVSQPKVTTDPMIQVHITDEPQVAAEVNAERYIPFSSSTLNKFANSRRVLFFYADWCPTCKVANEEFLQKTELIPTDVTLIRVNYNDSQTDQEEKDLAKKYGITYQHTFVQIDAQGNTRTVWNGGEIDELLANINK